MERKALTHGRHLQVLRTWIEFETDTDWRDAQAEIKFRKPLTVSTLEGIAESIKQAVLEDYQEGKSNVEAN